MTANKTLLQRKYTRLIDLFSKKANLPIEEAIDKFYNSNTYSLISQGVSDMHCKSDLYLTDELLMEYGYKENVYY